MEEEPEGQQHAVSESRRQRLEPLWLCDLGTCHLNSISLCYRKVQRVLGSSHNLKSLETRYEKRLALTFGTECQILGRRLLHLKPCCQSPLPAVLCITGCSMACIHQMLGASSSQKTVPKISKCPLRKEKLGLWPRINDVLRKRGRQRNSSVYM